MGHSKSYNFLNLTRETKKLHLGAKRLFDEDVFKKKIR